MGRAEQAVHIERLIQQTRPNLSEVSEVLDTAFAELLATHCSSACFCNLCCEKLATGSKLLKADKPSTVFMPQAYIVPKL